MYAASQLLLNQKIGWKLDMRLYGGEGVATGSKSWPIRRLKLAHQWAKTDPFSDYLQQKLTKLQ